MESGIEASIQRHSWPQQQGAPKPTLAISLDTLAEILYRENGVIAPEDVPGLLGAFHVYASRGSCSDQQALDAWQEAVAAMAEGQEEWL